MPHGYPPKPKTIYINQECLCIQFEDAFPNCGHISLSMS